jgi:hypothetical protein
MLRNPGNQEKKGKGKIVSFSGFPGFLRCLFYLSLICVHLCLSVANSWLHVNAMHFGLRLAAGDMNSPLGVHEDIHLAADPELREIDSRFN